MKSTPDFLLERFVHQLLSHDTHACRRLFNDALNAGMDAQWMLSEILWPATECVQQLRQDGSLSLRTFNHSIRTIAELASRLAPVLARDGRPANVTARNLFIISAPGEPSDSGAHLLTLLAESHGFTVFFAGAHLTTDELLFALTQIQPDALVIHGSLPSSLPATLTFLEKLKKANFWPQVQTAITGAMLSDKPCGADLRSRHPVELLELLALCPDHRATSKKQNTPHADALSLNVESKPDAVIRDLMFRYFPPRTSPHGI